MIRNDIYTTLAGKEYEVSALSNGKVYLYSEDQADVVNGFQQSPPSREIITVSGKRFTMPIENYQNLYQREITNDDNLEIYSINTYAIYQGREFQLCNENETEYLLWTSDSETAHELGFQNISLGDYEKWVTKSEVKHVFEVKEVISDYFDR